MTELYNVPASKVDMLLGSVAIGLCSSGGFCAGSQFVVDHQRINGPSFVFSASMPALLAVSASEGINLLRSTPSILTTLQENVHAARAILDRVDCITIPSHPASPIIHIYIRQHAPASLHPSAAITISHSAKQSNPTSVHSREVQTWEGDVEERMLQDVVEEALAQGVMITRAKRLKGQELVEARPSIKLALTSALTKKETEKAVGVVKSALVKVIGKKR